MNENGNVVERTGKTLKGTDSALILKEISLLDETSLVNDDASNTIESNDTKVKSSANQHVTRQNLDQIREHRSKRLAERVQKENSECVFKDDSFEMDSVSKDTDIRSNLGFGRTPAKKTDGTSIEYWRPK